MFIGRIVYTIIPLIVLFTPIQALHADTFAAGKLAYDAGNYHTAFKIWDKLAQQGHAEAQFNVAYMYEFGIEVATDYVQAAKWYGKASLQGDFRSQNFLGWMYENGRGVKRDRVEALKWLRMAAAQGNKQSLADYRIVARRHGQARMQEYHDRLLEALKQEMEKAKGRYESDPFPTLLDAANHIS